jgi:hypothetical protein
MIMAIIISITYSNVPSISHTKLLKKVYNRYMSLLTHSLQIRFDSSFYQLPTL